MKGAVDGGGIAVRRGADLSPVAGSKNGSVSAVSTAWPLMMLLSVIMRGSS
nr:hypothetical protein [Arthrobacter alpinus]